MPIIELIKIYQYLFHFSADFFLTIYTHFMNKPCRPPFPVEFMIAKSFSPYFNRPDISLPECGQHLCGTRLCMSNLKLIFPEFFVMLHSLSALCVLALMKECTQASKQKRWHVYQQSQNCTYSKSDLLLLSYDSDLSSAQLQTPQLWKWAVFGILVCLLHFYPVYRCTKIVFDTVRYAAIYI